ncbi:hypothetical protein [Aquamicrobium sp.]|uniref:hypothetical protein n=1 Tax=Aquamicrobium sp. TaxID=1872579 RepID=UPI00258E363E|nr:hypothetical protein [Aquamicrobium sp.]MCK9549180.1 hypothetical protein [Aquamicrobium sp.]
MMPIEAASYFGGSLLIIGGWLAKRVAEKMREEMKHDDVLSEICASAAELLHMVEQSKYPAASLKYNHIRRLARAIMRTKPVVPYTRTYSFKPELRAK